jgi:hypothetical protein
MAALRSNWGTTRYWLIAVLALEISTCLVEPTQTAGAPGKSGLSTKGIFPTPPKCSNARMTL